MSAPDTGELVVASWLGPQGRYLIRFTLGDLEWTHTPRQAERYARTVIRVAQLAAHDAAVLAQLAALGVGTDAAAYFIADQLRRARPAPDHTGTRPIIYSPVVSAATGEPIVQMEWTDGAGEPRGAQMDATAATMHAVHVLEVAAVTDLDDAYHSALVGSLGMNQVRARAVVDDLARFRASASS